MADNTLARKLLDACISQALSLGQFDILEEQIVEDAHFVYKVSLDMDGTKYSAVVSTPYRLTSGRMLSSIVSHSLVITSKERRK